MASKFLNLSTDNTLGGNSPSENKAVSEKAIKEYVDNNTPTESTVSGWGFTKNTGTVTSVNNVQPVNGNVTLPSSKYTAGTGLNLTNNEFSINQTNNTTTNFTIVGNPTINDGVASNFSDNNYLSVANQLSSSLSSFEIVTAISVSQYGDNSGILDAENYTVGHTIRLSVTSDGKVRFRISTDGSEIYPVNITSTNSIALNTKTFIKITYNISTGYVLYLSPNGSIWTQEATSSMVSRPFYSSSSIWRMGDNSAIGYALNGLLYLYDTYVKVDNALVWAPYTLSGVAMAANNLYGLVKPDNTSITVNNGIISSHITSTDVTNALGYTPYNSSNPEGYTSNVGTVTSVNNVQPVNGNVTIQTGSSLPDQTGHSGDILTTDGTDASWADTTQVYPVIETYINGNDWYRIWAPDSTGYRWCEQGSLYYKGSTMAGTDNTITFLKAFKDINYTFIPTPLHSVANLNQYQIYEKYVSRTASTTVLRVTSAIFGYSWVAKGYIADET